MTRWLVLVVPAAAGYCWWAASVRPFSVTSYVAVGIPVALGLSIAIGRGPAPGSKITPTGPAWPWAAVAVAASVIEVVGLLLGGDNRGFPTVSTVIDQSLRWQAVRFVLFAAWLLIGYLSWLAPRGRQPEGVE